MDTGKFLHRKTIQSSYLMNVGEQASLASQAWSFDEYGEITQLIQYRKCVLFEIDRLSYVQQYSQTQMDALFYIDRTLGCDMT